MADHLLQQARGADLIVAGMAPTSAPVDVTRQIDVCDLVSAGRPVLVVPNGVAPSRFERILVARNDTREAQQAIADALPLLAKCPHVSVVEITPPEELAAARTGLGEVARWLGQHQVKAEAKVTPSCGANANQLRTIARDNGADLIVAGAYGYKRDRDGCWGA